MGPLVKTFAPFNDQGCTRNGFMGRDAIHGAEARSPLVKYDAYLLIRSKLYPHYLVHFFVRRVAPRRAGQGSFLFRRLALAIEQRGVISGAPATRSGDDTDNCRRAARRVRARVCIEMTFVASSIPPRSADPFTRYAFTRDVRR